MQFLDALERRGRVLDHQTASYLSGAYLPSSRHVPCAYWNPALGRAYVVRSHPEGRYDYGGVRAAVRVG